MFDGQRLQLIIKVKYEDMAGQSIKAYMKASIFK